MTHEESRAAVHDRLSVDDALLIVVGVHLEAELRDRSLAYRLRELILRWIDQHVESGGLEQALKPLVLTDVWYLNNEPLLARPVVAIGDPEHNAATAYLANRIPIGLVIDETLQVHVDQEYVDLRCCLWGISTAATASAVDLFSERYLDAFLRSAHDLPLKSP